jgi:hypothetical protein
MGFLGVVEPAPPQIFVQYILTRYTAADRVNLLNTIYLVGCSHSDIWM